MKRITFANVQAVAVALSALGLVAILTAQTADAQSVSRRKLPTIAAPKAERVNNGGGFNNGNNSNRLRIARPKGNGNGGNATIQLARPKGNGNGGGNGGGLGNGNGAGQKRIARPKGGNGGGIDTAQIVAPKSGRRGNGGGNGGGNGFGNGGGRVDTAQIVVPKSGRRGNGNGGGNGTGGGGGLGNGGGGGNGGGLARNRKRGQVEQVALRPTDDVADQIAAPKVERVKPLQAQIEQNEPEAAPQAVAPEGNGGGKATITITEEELVALIRKYRGLEVETYDEGGYETYYAEPTYGYSQRSYGNYGESCR